MYVMVIDNAFVKLFGTRLECTENRVRICIDRGYISAICFTCRGKSPKFDEALTRWPKRCFLAQCYHILITYC